jgi:hypothetical protein
MSLVSQLSGEYLKLGSIFMVVYVLHSCRMHIGYRRKKFVIWCGSAEGGHLLVSNRVIELQPTGSHHKNMPLFIT